MCDVLPLRDYIEDLTSRHPEIKELWLIGSRANGTDRPDSDWDVLAFGDINLAPRIQEDVLSHRDDVDLLVVDPITSSFQKPWGNRRKAGDLAKWQWHQVGPDKATYRSAKWIPDPVQKYPGTETGNFDERFYEAKRIWCRS